MKGKRPQYDLKESTVYKTYKDAHTLASEVGGAVAKLHRGMEPSPCWNAVPFLLQVKYKRDLKKLHKPVTDMAESLSMQHGLNTSRLSSDVRHR